jgi:hypothetical protein
MQQLILVATGVYLVVLVVTAYFTRATRRRATGAVVGGAAVAVVGVGVECLAHAVGWWRYPPIKSPYGPPLMYPVIALLFAALALIGWRVTRRFGWRGQATLLFAVALLGTLRDYRVAAWLPQFIVIAPGIGIVLVDAACWTGLLVVAQVVMRLAAGPVREDQLARQPPRPAQTLAT